MPKPYPREFRGDVVRVALSREPARSATFSLATHSLARLRQLEGGPAYDVISCSLREPQFTEVIHREARGVRPPRFGLAFL